VAYREKALRQGSGLVDCSLWFNSWLVGKRSRISLEQQGLAINNSGCGKAMAKRVHGIEPILAVREKGADSD
jgi:hypothetical protein